MLGEFFLPCIFHSLLLLTYHILANSLSPQDPLVNLLPYKPKDFGFCITFKVFRGKIESIFGILKIQGLTLMLVKDARKMIPFNQIQQQQ